MTVKPLFLEIVGQYFMQTNRKVFDLVLMTDGSLSAQINHVCCVSTYSQLLHILE